MLKLIIRQANWGILGSLFAFLVGFFIKTYVIRLVGPEDWGKYVTAHTFVTISDTLLSLGIPFVILRFLPSLFDKNPDKARFIVIKILRYAIMISLIFMISIYFSKDILDIYLYTEIEDFHYLLLIISIHAPISIFMGIITSLYRSVLKIKEIIIYGTFIAVSLRGILTFVVFQYSADIISFVFIEISVYLIILFLMFYFFNKREFRILKNTSSSKDMDVDNNIYSYGKKMYLNSIISLFSTQSLSFLIGVLLPPKEMGVYSVLLTITAVSMFLNKNLRKIFSPAIAKLYDENKIHELDILYKKTTFIVNFLTIPFSILIMFFADEVLGIFSQSGEFLEYKPYLFILLLARMIYLLAGNSGSFMIMAGIEKKEIIIQAIRGFLSILLVLIFIKEYELIAVIVMFFLLMVFVTIAQLVSIKREINISPFSSELLFLILLSIPFIYFSINQQINIKYYHFLFAPIILYLIYFLVFYNRLKKIYTEIR